MKAICLDMPCLLGAAPWGGLRLVWPPGGAAVLVCERPDGNVEMCHRSVRPCVRPRLQCQQLRVREVRDIKSGFSTSLIRTLTLKIGAIRESLAAVQPIPPPSVRLELFAQRNTEGVMA